MPGAGSRGVVVDGLVAGAAGGVVGGLPSTTHALLTGGDPLEAALAAGAMLLPREARRGRLLLAAVLVHGSISAFWGVVLAAVLPRRTGAAGGAVAGLAIAALDLGAVGRRLPRIRRLATGPQLADHALYGAVVGAVLARRHRQRAAGVLPWIHG